MAARGSVAKTSITKDILDKFKGAFIASDGKTIRIPFTEEGEVVEIKVTLTAAKDIEGNGAAAAAPKADRIEFKDEAAPAVDLSVPTDAEKAMVQKLMAGFDF